jgi:hypothetical protein
MTAKSSCIPCPLRLDAEYANRGGGHDIGIASADQAGASSRVELDLEQLLRGRVILGKDRFAL